MGCLMEAYSRSLKGDGTEVSDTILEWSLAGLTALVVVWMVCSTVFLGLLWFWAVGSGLLLEIGLAGCLVYIWGKSFIKRVQ